MQDSFEANNTPPKNNTKKSKVYELPYYSGTFLPNPKIARPDGTPYDNNAVDNSDPFSDFRSIVNSKEVDPRVGTISLDSFSRDKRYSQGTRPGDDWEEAYAQNQTRWEKAYSGTIKGLNLAATTFVGGIGTVLYGLPSAFINGDITKIWNNQVSQGLQAWNEKMDREILPNFYTQQEQNAEWWSRDNWMTANFLFDKLIKNAGFAVGAMYGGNLANTLLLRAGSAIGAGAARLNAAAQLENANRAFKLMSPLLRNTSRAFSQGKNVEAFEILKNNISSISDVAKKTNQLKELTASAAKFADFGDDARRTLVALYSSAGEASMEAVMGGNQMRETLIEKYIEENGVAPTGKELQAIDETVRSFGKNSFFGNMALLGVTEFVQLPYLAGSSWKNSRNAIKNITDDVASKAGKLEAIVPTTKFGKFKQGVKKYGNYVFDPKEMGQEIGQYALEVGASNYFEKANQSEEAENILEGMLNFFSEAPSVLKEVGTYGLFGRDEEGEGVGALVSKEGMEGGILGGLTGGMMQAGRKYKADKQRKTNTQKLIEESKNSPLLSAVLKDRIRTVNRAVVLQEQQQQAVLNNDILESKDLKTDLAFNYAMHKIKFGRTDLVLADIKEMEADLIKKGDEGFQELVKQGLASSDDTKETLSQRLSELKTFITNLDETFTNLNTIYGSQTIQDPSTGELKRKFSDASIERLAYITTKIADYDKRIPELKLNVLKSGLVIDEALSEAVLKNNLDELNKKLAEVDSLNELDYTKDQKQQIKNEIVDLADLSLRKKKFIDEYNEVTSKPENFVSNVSDISDEVDNDDKTPKQKIKIKTKAGEREIEIGTEYFLGKVVEYNEKGFEVYRVPKLTVLGENEDGTIKIKDSKGDVRDVSKEVLEDYKLAKVSSTLKNKVAKYYLEHMNSVFEFYGKKITNEKGERVPVKGRLEYEKTEKDQKDKLFFAYKDEKGKIVRKEIDGSMVIPKNKKYKHAILKHIGNLTPAQQKAEQEFGKTTSETVQAKLQRRADTLNQLYEEVLEKQENTQKLISEKQEKLQKIREQITSLDRRSKKTVKFKKAVKEAMYTVTQLSKMEQDLILEIEELKTLNDELNLNIDYVEDLIENIDILPESTKEFLNELQDEVIDLEIMVEQTSKQIIAVNELIDSTRDAIKSAIRYLSNLISNFQARYPNVPTSIGQQWVDFLKDNPNFLKLKPNYRVELEVVEQIVAETEDLEIIANEKRLEDLDEHLEILQNSLNEYDKQIRVRENVLNKLEEIYNKYLQQKKEEAELANNEKLRQEFIGTLDSSIQPVAADVNDEKVYEVDAKKDDYAVVGGTRPVTNDRPHNLRANRFGVRFNTFSEKKKQKIKGRIITASTEELQGLKGLSNLIVDGEANPNDVIALVMVSENKDGTFSLVNEFGEVLSEEQLQNPLDHVVFQVFPSDSLQGNYSGKTESMFRNATAEDRKPVIEELTKQYREWRKEILSQEELQYPKDFKASFGIPQYVKTLVEKQVGGKTIQVEEIDYTVTTPVSKTGVIEEVDLETSKAITVSTGEFVTEGSVKFATKPGRVFLSVPGGLIKLNNRKLNKKEATTVYEAILQLAKLAKDKKTIKDDPEAQNIIRWLKTVVYWGIAKNPQTKERKQAGYNNIWFETFKLEDGKETTRLFISGKGFNINFSPTEIEKRKNEIIGLVNELYHNVNATSTNDNSWNNPYFEIVGFEKDGTPVTREWKNYQTYLLSSEGRKDEDIPLTTILRPKQGENDITRTGVYFTLNETADKFNFEIAKPAPKSKPVKTPTPPTTDTKVQDFDRSGKPFTYELNAGKVTVSLDTEGNATIVTDNNDEYDEQTTLTLQKVAEAKNVQLGEALSFIIQAIELKTKPVAEQPSSPTETIPTEEFIMDGKTPNNYKLSSGEVTVLIDESGKVSLFENENEEYDDQTSATIRKISQDKNRTLEEAASLIIKAVELKTKPIALAKSIPTDNAVTATPVVEAPVIEPTTPVSTEVKPAEETKTEQPTNDPFSQAPETNGISDIDKKAYRLALDNIVSSPTEDFRKLEQWLKSNFPNIPIYRVKNPIMATNGRQAWGMFHKGAIYLYENAEVGTAYHEVFEAVWAMMTSPEERNAVAKDFRSREGSYVDRFTGETVEYKNATDDQMREELAEEFRDFILHNKNPKTAQAPKTTSLIRKIFNEILDFIKSFFIEKDAIKNTKDLFDRIGNGYYKNYNPYEQKLSFANVGYIDINEVFPDSSSTFRLENISATEIHQLMQHMTYTTITQMIGNNDDLFNVEKLNKTELYEIIKNDILNKRIKAMADQITIDAAKQNRQLTEKEEHTFNNFRTLYNNVANQWELIKKKHQEYLASYGITFDESDNIDYENYEKSKDEGYGDARKIDAFKKLNSTIKLLLSSLPEIYLNKNVANTKINSIGGVNLLPLGSVYVDLLNKLHTSTDLTDMINKFRQVARNNPNYRSLFERIFKIDPVSETPIDFKALSKNDLRIINGFWKTFKKQAPTVSALFVLPNGDIVVGDSNTAGAVRENRRQFINSVITSINTNENPFVVKHKTKGFVKTDKVLKRNEASNIKEAVSFLKFIGIEFTESSLRKLNDSDIKLFIETSNGILKSFKDIPEEGIEKINSNTLDISGRLLELGLIKSKTETSEFETTYFNINGEKSQTFLGPNVLSSFYDFISNVDSIEDLVGTQYEYLLTDSFVANSSIIMYRLFNKKGEKTKVSDEILKPYIIDGTFDEDYGKNTESSKLSKKQRYVQNINMNLKGIYMNLVPGDASMETAIKLHDSNSPFVTKDMLANKTHLDIFKMYFVSELNMSREDNRRVSKNRTNSDLRFFKSILGKDLHNKIVKAAQNSTASSESIFDIFEKEINKKVEEFIETKTVKSLNKLMQYNIITPSPEGGFNVENISAFKNEESYSKEAIKEVVKQQQINFMIANIELHKLIYSDPYQYSDELKRIKNFSSPRQIVGYGNNGINERLNDLYNNEEKEDKLFNTNFNRDTINGATISDVVSDYPELEYDSYEETDGGGLVTDKGNRYIKIKNGEWTEENEQQYIYDMAYMKRVLGKKLNDIEQERWKKGNPNNQNNYTPLKPILAGNKNMGRSYNDVVLDKFALFPISFRLIHQINPTSNMLKLYEKMIEDEVDYVVFESGRKVGKENVYQIYDEDGNFNKAPLISKEEKQNPTGSQTVLTLPLSIFAIQTEVPTKETNEVTQGSQPTKLATMDFMEAGVPIDFLPEEKSFEVRLNEWNKLLDKGSYNNGDNLYNEIILNKELLEARIENGVNKLMKRLGIKKLPNNRYELSNPELTFKILKEELLKREINDNILDALDGYESGRFVLEAIPSYQQIRNIIYSIAHKSVVAPKIRGAQKVQVSSAMLESQRAKAKEITDANGNKKLVYKSNILNFYKDEDGKRVAEVMISRWFNSSLSDEKLLEFLNETEEGQRILSGVAFRIPTQKQNSIERFKIAKFLPKEYGDTVIVPSALVKKVGSDFDIDKLFMYFKNVYTTNDGKLKTIPYFGIGEEAKEKFRKMHDSGELNEYIKSIKDGLPQGEAEDRLIESIFPEAYSTQREDVVDKLYRESLDNAYIESFEKLVSHPLNFKNLVKPNSAKQMQDLTKEIETLLGNEKIDYSDVGQMLDREFMSELRNDFVRGKYAIGIAATSQTGNAQSQKTSLTIDKSKFDNVPDRDKEWLGDVNIKFEKYNTIKGEPTLSKIEDANDDPDTRNYISDVIGQVIDGYVDVNKDPWIMRLGITPNVAGTWLFLIRLGVPLRDIAFFMNQPIIRDYLQLLENNGKSYLFNGKMVEAIKFDYELNATEGLYFETIPSVEELSKMIGKDEESLDELQAAQQLFILDEFLKYSKMAEHLLTFTQATNFDTSTFNDPFLIFKKLKQIEKARQTIFSDVDEFLDSSFIGKLKDAIIEFREGISEILISDSSSNPNGESIRSVLETVLTPYLGMNDSDFISISKKAVLTLFDWAVQTDRKINTELSRVLLSNEKGKSTASEIMQLKREAENPNHPLHNNYLLKSVQIETAQPESNEANNLYISAISNKVYDQNQIIYSLREIKSLLSEDKKYLYGDLIRLAVLQSGLTNSRIAFTSLIPFEDFLAVYNDTLSKINIMPNLSDFVDLNVLERINWNDPNIVPQHKEKVIITKTKKRFKPETSTYTLPKKVTVAMNNGEIPKTILISNMIGDARSDVMTYVWSDVNFTGSQKRAMIKRGDYSFMKKALFKKVYVTNEKGISSPAIYETKSKDGKIYKNYVYKMINAWGDSLYAKEFYGKIQEDSSNSLPSIFDNGYEKAKPQITKLMVGPVEVERKSSGEVEDSKVLEFFGDLVYPENDLLSLESKNNPLDCN